MGEIHRYGRVRGRILTRDTAATLLGSDSE